MYEKPPPFQGEVFCIYIMLKRRHYIINHLLLFTLMQLIWGIPVNNILLESTRNAVNILTVFTKK